MGSTGDGAGVALAVLPEPPRVAPYTIANAAPTDATPMPASSNGRERRGVDVVLLTPVADDSVVGADAAA